MHSKACGLKEGNAYIAGTKLLLLVPDTLYTSLQQRNEFYHLGQYIAMSVVQGGCGLPCLAEPVYEYICSGKCTNLDVDNEEIPDPDLKFVIQKVCLRSAY